MSTIGDCVSAPDCCYPADTGVEPTGPDTDDTDDSRPDAGGGGDDVVCDSVALTPVCTADWYADGECDPSNNAAECEWDGGDCCAASCTAAGCGELIEDLRAHLPPARSPALPVAAPT